MSLDLDVSQVFDDDLARVGESTDVVRGVADLCPIEIAGRDHDSIDCLRCAHSEADERDARVEGEGEGRRGECGRNHDGDADQQRLTGAASNAACGDPGEDHAATP